MFDTGCFDSALYCLPERLSDILRRLPSSVRASAEELRLRSGLPVALTVMGETVFVTKSSETSFTLCDNLLIADSSQLESTFLSLCEGSVYAHTDELKRGFIMMKNGCRAGVCGTLTEKGGMRDITSVNLRIAKEIQGAANELITHYTGGGLLIAGPPGSGKTTILRDFIRQLSSGFEGRYRRIAVIDSRGELSGSAVLNLGAATDVLVTSCKATGIELALRTLFPDIIAFDEIGSLAELKGVKQSLCSGVSIVTTAHIGSASELMQREITRELIKSGAISQIAVLPRLHGAGIRILGSKELLYAAV